jgi:two-component system cell cycle sensor histidine kinase/response regulator CckA
MATRVLVVDDEPVILDLVGRALSSRGYAVETALGADQALAMANSSTFDLVLSDVVMPGMCGPELVKEIVRCFPATAVVMMSGYFPNADFLPPKTTFISKPFVMKDLLATVEKALKKTRPNGN